MTKTYRLRERAHDDLLQDLLLARGVVGAEAAELFLSPEYESGSHDPFLLADMEVAVERILAAQKNAERVAVWSDYDCDGIPGGVMLADFLRELKLAVTHYIPHRHTEGYGLNKEGIDALAEQGVTLIITIDLGTTEHENIVYAKTKGIEVIVTDHHIVQDEAPHPAFALINPKRPDSHYPFDGLCGAGVAWKLVQALLVQNRPEGFTEGQEKWYLDLVGIATLCDMVPLVGENRMLAHFGLRVMRKGRRPGLAALLKLLRIKLETLTEDDIGFMIGPRINAASRMDSPSVAARLLATTNAEEAREVAYTLNKINDERKGAVAVIVKEVNKRLLGSDLSESPLIVMGNPKWRPGVLGLVASSLVGTHGKSVFLWGREGGEVIRGSCRSDGVINVVSLMSLANTSLRGAGDLFDHFGGHFASGGFSLSEERVHELAAKLNDAYARAEHTEDTTKEIIVDRQSELAELSFALKRLERLAPFGVGNERPLFLFSHVAIQNIRTFGKANDHLELSLEQNGARAGSIAFFATPLSFQKQCVVGDHVDVVGHIERDWRGNPRIRIVDIV
ncbi:MAG TPA: single-stranded-DNA-specific exonuclease RecJ [Candidatus Paceibacterota bacterium]|nr:single-stranded-DNA-specific exonuclease RecJ [Candidatus Paceibacterota bacterium]